MIGALVFLAIVVGGGISARAAVTTLALYRLGEDDAGAVSGNTGNATTTDAVGFFDLDRGGDPTYSSNTPGPGSTLSMAFDGTGDVYSRGEPVTTAIDKWGIEAWVFVTTLDTGGENRIIAFNGDPDSNGWGLIQQDNLILGLFGSGNGAGSVITEVDRWYHVAWVHDGVARWYFNGVTTIGSDAVFVAPTDPFLIGGNIAGSGYFEGNIDHVRVFSFEDSTFDPQTDLSLGIPEPSTVILAAIGLVGLAAFGWRRRNRLNFGR